MATSGSASVTVTGWNTLKFTWSRSSTSVANNTSTIAWKLQLIAGSSGRISSTASKDWSVTVNGAKYSGTTTVGIAANATKTLASGTTVITHAADGSKTFTYSFSQEFGITFSGSTIGTKTGNGTGKLDTIPRATQPALSSTSVNMGSAVVISLPRAASGFTHDLAYSFDGAAYVGIASGVGTSYTWTVPDKASSIPNDTSAGVTVRCITKNGNTTVGTKTVGMTAKVPSNVVPIIDEVVVTEATAGLAAQFGAFIQSKSALKIVVTAAGAKGSTVKSYRTTLQGSTYTAASFTSKVLTSAGKLNLVTTVTDSRGRTAKKTTTVTVLAYTKPQIKRLGAYRYDVDGNPAEDGEYAGIDYAYSVPTLNGGNTAAMTVQYKRSTAADSEYATLLTGTAISADTTALPTDLTFSTDYSYTVKMTVKDYFGATATALAELPSGAVILDILADGKGLAIGETAQKSGVFRTAWELETANAEIPKDAKSLPASANLNDYTTPGFYVFSSATAATLSNSPVVNGSGSVEVFREGDSTQVRQVVTRCSVATREIWERLYYSNKWQEWLCIYKGSSGTGRVLWSGAMQMQNGQTASLSEPISAQPNGIALVFSEWVDSAAVDQSFHTRVVPKYIVTAHAGKAQCVQLATSNLAYFATKYLYIKDSEITGHANNNTTGKGACGITYTNTRFVLRYVIGI